MNTTTVTNDVMIIAFTKDWEDVPTCTTHILCEMAKTIPVLWVCSIGTRKPQAASPKDWRRLCKRVASACRRSEEKAPNLRVLRPLLVPKAETRLSQWLNRLLFRFYRWREIPRRFSGTLEYWCFVPNAVDLIPASTATTLSTRTIYYCADDWTQFHNLDGHWMAAKEQNLLQRSQVVFATSRYLVDKFRDLCATQKSASPTVVYMPHGVDYAAFSRALNNAIPVPDVCRDIPTPIIGFYGNLHAWVDFNLIGRLAAKRPDWSFVLIGEIYDDIDAIDHHANIHLLGRKEHATLPDFCRAFDVAMIPYDVSDERMESVNPVKVKELLAAGLPIVASAIPELTAYHDGVRICKQDSEWLEAIEQQLRLTREARVALSKSVKNEDWQRKVLDIRQAVD